MRLKPLVLLAVPVLVATVACAPKDDSSAGGSSGSASPSAASCAKEDLPTKKSGTLTVGNPEVVDVVVAPGRSDSEVLALAAAVDAHSEHPLARAIVARAGEVTERATAFTNIDGRGARGEVGASVRPAQRVGLGARVPDARSGRRRPARCRARSGRSR